MTSRSYISFQYCLTSLQQRSTCLRSYLRLQKSFTFDVYQRLPGDALICGQSYSRRKGWLLCVIRSFQSPGRVRDSWAQTTETSTRVCNERATWSRGCADPTSTAGYREIRWKTGQTNLSVHYGLLNFHYFQISKVVMMASKDVRPLLAALAADSLISTQEVPKSADRNPTRTFYLWCVISHVIKLMILHFPFQVCWPAEGVCSDSGKPLQNVI